MSLCYLNGAFLPLSEARVSVLDRGFMFGDAVYEVIPVVAGRTFAGDEHLARLAGSLAAVGIAEPLSAAQWNACFERLIEDYGGGDLSIYVQVTRGVAARDHRFPAGVAPTVFAMCQPLTVSRELTLVSAITLPDNRWGRCDIKSTSLLANVLLRNEALRRGAQEAILLRGGLLTEGAASNVFVVCAGIVLTPPTSSMLLAGVTRNLLVRLVGACGFVLREQTVTERMLRAADEVWITSSSRDVLAVRELDGVAVGDAAHYPVARAVLAALQAQRAPAASGSAAE